MPTPGFGITYQWTEDYQDTNGPDGEVITAQLHTPWSRDNLRLFPTIMKGANFKQNNKIYRDPLPYTHPTKRWLYCTQCDLQGAIGYPAEETADTLIKFSTPSTHDTTKAVWEAQWAYLGYDLATDAYKEKLAGTGKELCRFVSRKVKPTVISVPKGGTSFRFTADLATIKEPTTVLLAMKELEYTWWHIPFPYKESTWDGLLSKVNSDVFDGRTRGDSGVAFDLYAADTIYFQGYVQSDPFTDPAGNICCNATFTFLYRPTGWNKFWRPGTGWAAVISLGGTRKPFTTADLNTIFD